jgi:L-threonylcarbamoyladenylate synthase
MGAFWPGPLTLVFNASDLLPEIVTQEQKTVAVRIPASALCMSLLKLSGCPITATSANLAGLPTPKTVSEIKDQLGPSVDLFLDAGELPEVKPSTLVDVSGTTPKILREGSITYDRLKEISPEIIQHSS